MRMRRKIYTTIFICTNNGYQLLLVPIFNSLTYVPKLQLYFGFRVVTSIDFFIVYNLRKYDLHPLGCQLTFSSKTLTF